MEAIARSRFKRISPRKVRAVSELVVGKPAEEALAILKFTPRKAARMLEKLVLSAVSNAAQKDSESRLTAEDLYIKQILADSGPIMRRWRARARGRATRIRHRTSHITVKVAAIEDEN